LVVCDYSSIGGNGTYHIRSDSLMLHRLFSYHLFPFEILDGELELPAFLEGRCTLRNQTLLIEIPKSSARSSEYVIERIVLIEEHVPSDASVNSSEEYEIDPGARVYRAQADGGFHSASSDERAAFLLLVASYLQI
jgi:hypothetical protein